MTNETVPQRLTGVRARIEAAARRSSRHPEEITLVAVTKRVDLPAIGEAVLAGVRDLGESYVQEALLKQRDERMHSPGIRWHLIGHLQSNKVRDVVGNFALIHSVDSVPLARELGKRASQTGHEAEILLQVSLDPTDTKFGFAMDDALRAVESTQQIAGIKVKGLMGIAPYSVLPEASRPYFRMLRTLFDSLPSESRQILSMGMTGDFEVAIEEGATLVRIGTAIFGPRLGGHNS